MHFFFLSPHVPLLPQSIDLVVQLCSDRTSLWGGCTPCERKCTQHERDKLKVSFSSPHPPSISFSFHFYTALENSLEFICGLKQWRRMACKCFQPFGFFHGFHSLFGLVSTFRTYTFFGCRLQKGSALIPIMQAFHYQIVIWQVLSTITTCCFSAVATATVRRRNRDKKQIMAICSGQQHNIKSRIKNRVGEDLTRSTVR